MDLIKSAIVVLGILVSELALISHGSFVFPVHHKFKDHPEPIKAMREHDAARHKRRSLTAFDFGLGGLLDKTWCYYTKLRIGTPPLEYNMQIDSGSSIPWLMCYTNKNSPNKTDGGIGIKLYNPRNSSTSRLERCKKDKCLDYTPFADGSKIGGFYVWDVLEFGRVNEDFHTEKTSTLIRFGCGVRMAGEKAPPHSIGILGLSTDRQSLISQLAEKGFTKPEFAHCLDRSRGGGIFVIGEVVEPKVKTTTLYLDPIGGHYVTYLTGFMVGGEHIDVPLLNDPKGFSATIDSGSSMSLFPKMFHDAITKKIIAQQPHLTFGNNSEAFQSFCFGGFQGNVDDVLPTLTFEFEGGLTLTVPAHDYIVPDKDTLCTSFSMSEQVLGPNGDNFMLLGDDTFTNKFVVYDLENQKIGWTKHDCTTSIKVRDRQSGSVYSMGAHNLGS